MKAFFLHVGLPRCASTLIENIFHYAKYDGYKALQSANIRPLPRIYMELRRVAPKPVWDEDLRVRIHDYHLAPMHGHDADGFFVSDESLSELGEDANIPPVVANRAGFLGRLLEGFQARILLIVRNQADYLVSRYGLHLQNGGTQDFGPYFDAFPRDRLDWHAVADTYASAFGDANVTVIPFERHVHETSGGTSRNFLDAFQQAMDIPQPARLENQLLINPSLVPRYFPAQLAINRATDKEAARAANPIPEDERAFVKLSSDSPLTADMRQALLEEMMDSNTRLFSRFMPGYDGSSYQPAGRP